MKEEKSKYGRRMGCIEESKSKGGGKEKGKDIQLIIQRRFRSPEFTVLDPDPDETPCLRDEPEEEGDPGPFWLGPVLPVEHFSVDYYHWDGDCCFCRR